MLDESDFTIVSRYQAEFRGVVQYYMLAQNVSHFSRLQWVMQQSLCRTLARKHNSSAKKMADKYRTKVQTEYGLKSCLEVMVERGPDKPPLIARFGNIPLRRKQYAIIADHNPQLIKTERTELLQRLLADVCELCGSTDKVEVHHIRHLKDLNSTHRRNRPRWMKSWSLAGERHWLLAGNVTTKSIRANTTVKVSRNNYWRAGCAERRTPGSEGGRWKRTLPSGKAPRRRPTLQADYNTARVRQASRRSWRIGQTQPVRIYYLTYADTKQTQAIYLIAQKVATSLAVEGDLSSDGLTALAGGGDNMGRSIAQMLVDSDIEFDGSFESGISIAALATDSEGEELLGDTDYDVAAMDEEVEPELPDGLTPDMAASLVSQTLIETEPDMFSGSPAGTEIPNRDNVLDAIPDGIDMPLFGTLVTGAEALEVCDGCEQFILTDEERITTPALEIIEGRNGRISDRTAPARVFHTGCYAPWQRRMNEKAGVERIDAPVNVPKQAPEPAVAPPDPASFGAVSMDSWMSAFGLAVEDLERGKRKKTRRSRKKADSEQESLIPLS